MRRFLRLMAVVFVGITSFTPSSAGGTDVDPTGRWPVCGVWRRVPVHGEQHGHAEDIEVVSPTDAWMVSSVGTGARNESHIYRWAGVRWSETSVPRPKAHRWALTSIEAVSAGQVWAVGYRDAKDGEGLPVPITARWDGARWQLVPVKIQRIRGSLEGLAVMPGTGQLLAVGSTGRGVQTLALRWDGRTWARVPSPAIGSRSSFRDVTSVGGAVWAVGGAPLEYNRKAELLNPEFFAVADGRYPWRERLPPVPSAAD